MAYTDIETEVIQRINEYSTDAATQVDFARTALSSMEAGINSVLGSGVSYSYSGGSATSSSFPTGELDTIVWSDTGTLTPLTLAHPDEPLAPTIDDADYPDAITAVTGFGALTVLTVGPVEVPSTLQEPSNLIDNISNLAPQVINPTLPSDPGSLVLDSTRLPDTVQVGTIDAVTLPVDVPSQTTYLADIASITKDGEAINMVPTVTGTPSDVSIGATVPDELVELILPTFDSLLPTDTLDVLVAAYSFSEGAYTELLKDETQAVILGVLNGGLVIPTSTWNALWDADASDITRIQVAEEWSASNFAASMGMTGLPSETLFARLDAAEQRAAEQLSKSRRDKTIQEAIQHREDVWNSVRESVAFESMWIQQHSQIQGRALATAAKAHEAQVAVYNANVARYNALLVYTGHAVRIKEVELSSLQVRLEEYRMKLQRVESLIKNDDNQIKAWLGQWDGWKAQEDIKVNLVQQNISEYVSKVNADKARLDGEVAVRKSATDVQVANTNIYNGLIDGQRLRHSADVAGETLVLEAAKANTQVYNAYVGGEKAKSDVDVSGQQLAAEAGRIDVAAFQAGWQAVATQTEHVSKLWERTLQQYRASIDFNNGLSTYNNSLTALKQAELANKVAVEQSKASSISSKLSTFRELWNSIKIEQDAIATIMNSRATMLNADTGRKDLSYKYEALDKQVDLTTAEQTAKVALDSLGLTLNTSLSSIGDFATLNVGAMQAFLGASDVSLQAGASAGVQWSQNISGECASDVSCSSI